MPLEAIAQTYTYYLHFTHYCGGMVQKFASWEIFGWVINLLPSHFQTYRVGLRNAIIFFNSSFILHVYILEF